MSRIISRQITKDRFSFDCSSGQALQLLQACYTAEVKTRGRECLMDGATTGNLQRLAQWLTDPADPRFGVLFSGGTGTGKTTMMRALADAIEYMAADEGEEQRRLCRTLYIVDAVKAGPKDAGTMMLGIDDLGTEPVEVQDYGNITTPIIDLLTRRYQSRYFTAVTTNLTPKEIRQRYGDRIADRCNEMFITIGFSQGTYRSTVHVDKYRTQHGVEK